MLSYDDKLYQISTKYDYDREPRFLFDVDNVV